MQISKQHPSADSKEASIGLEVRQKLVDGNIPKGLAKNLLGDARVCKLSLRAIGALVLIGAHQSLGLKVHAERNSIAGLLRVSTHVFDSIYEELMVQDPPLIKEVDGFVFAQTYSDPRAQELSSKRAQAARHRWNKPKQDGKSESMLTSEPVLQKPAKVKRLKKPSPEITPQHSLFEDITTASSPAAEPLGFHLGSKSAAVSEDDIPRRSNTPYAKIASIFLECCPSLQAVQQVSEWNEYRKEQLRSRWATHPDLEWWRMFFTKVEKSDFLTRRRQGNTFKASFDWLLKPVNFQKVINGNFENAENAFRPSGLTPTQFKQGTYGDHELGKLKPWDKRGRNVDHP